MATVLLSSYIRRCITRGIESLFETRIQAVQESFQLKLPEISQRWIEEALPSEVKALRNTPVGNTFLRMGTDVRITVKYKVPVKGFPDKEQTASEVITFSSKMPFPQTANWQGWGNNIYLPTSSCVYEEVATHLKNIRNIVAERDDLIEQTNTLLNRCTTLKQVLDVWPGCWEYIPEDIRARHAAKATPRKQRKQEIAASITPDFTVGLTKAKMLSESTQ